MDLATIPLGTMTVQAQSETSDLEEFLPEQFAVYLSSQLDSLGNDWSVSITINDTIVNNQILTMRPVTFTKEATSENPAEESSFSWSDAASVGSTILSIVQIGILIL